jgi:hypothetical protein
MPDLRSRDYGRQGDTNPNRFREFTRAGPRIEGHPLKLTPAEYQRRYRAGIRTGKTGEAPMVWEQARNGLPETPGYVYRGRRYPWAEAVLAAAEAIHGAPVPTCPCGQPAGSPRIVTGRIAGGVLLCYDCAEATP